MTGPEPRESEQGEVWRCLDCKVLSTRVPPSGDSCPHTHLRRFVLAEQAEAELEAARFQKRRFEEAEQRISQLEAEKGELQAAARFEMERKEDWLTRFVALVEAVREPPKEAVEAAWAEWERTRHGEENEGSMQHAVEAAFRAALDRREWLIRRDP